MHIKARHLVVVLPHPQFFDRITIVSVNKFGDGQLFVNSERSKSDESKLKISGLILIKGYIIGMV